MNVTKYKLECSRCGTCYWTPRTCQYRNVPNIIPLPLLLLALNLNTVVAVVSTHDTEYENWSYGLTNSKRKNIKLNYWHRLKKFSMSSFQLHRQHNIICMTRKIFHQHCSDDIIIILKIHPWLPLLSVSCRDYFGVVSQHYDRIILPQMAQLFSASFQPIQRKELIPLYTNGP